ncbi:MAG TPA: putative DNA-binding domain-containing protein [Marinagarivorans sp.]
MKTQKHTAPKNLADFQAAYGKHLRNPSALSRPERIPVRASEIYEDLFFNNICGFINNCFPVAKSLYSDDTWQLFCRRFFVEWRCHTPYFSKIPREFVDYIQSGNHTLDLPPWFGELIEYEWLELDVDICNATPLNGANKAPPPSHTPSQREPILYANPTLRNCAFEWPVHRISADYQPEHPEATFLAIYRNSEHRVQFMAMNAVTAALLQVIEQGPCTTLDALERLAAAINHPDPAQIINFGQSLIDDFIQRGILASTV